MDDENIPTPQISVTEIQNTKYPLGICMYKFTYNGQENLAFTLVVLLLIRYTDVNKKRICPYGCSILKKMALETVNSVSYPRKKIIYHYSVIYA